MKPTIVVAALCFTFVICRELPDQQYVPPITSRSFMPA